MELPTEPDNVKIVRNCSPRGGAWPKSPLQKGLRGQLV